MQLILDKKPWLLIGSPMCTIFSAIQALNKKKMGSKRWRAAYAYGLSHLLFALELYAVQIKAGRYMLHEHPLSASSWRVPEVVEFMTLHGLTRVRGDMCCFNMVQKDVEGWALIKKPTGYMCNSLYIRSELERKCSGGHKHIPLMSGRA